MKSLIDWLVLTVAPLFIFQGGKKEGKINGGGWLRRNIAGDWAADGPQGLKSCVSSSHRDLIRSHQGKEKSGLGSAYQPETVRYRDNVICWSEAVH